MRQDLTDKSNRYRRKGTDLRATCSRQDTYYLLMNLVWGIIQEKEKAKIGAVLRWQRNRMGRPLSPHKFIKRTLECWANTTKQLLNAGRGNQAPRKAAHCLLKEVGQNTKDKKRDKRVRDGPIPSQVGVLKEGKFPNTRKPSYQWVCGEFWNLREQHNREEK